MSGGGGGCVYVLCVVMCVVVWLYCTFGCVVWLFCSLVVLVVLCFQVNEKIYRVQLTRYVMFIIFHCHCRCYHHCCG